MTLSRPDGERDAVIIPFPVRAEAQAETDTQSGGENPTIPALITEFPNAPAQYVQATNGPATNGYEALPSAGESSEAESGSASPRLVRRAHNVSVHALAGRSQSRHEITQRLLSRDLPEDVVENELVALQEAGLINDEALVDELVEKYGYRQGLGRHAVAARLRQRHVAPALIEEALAGMSDEDESDKLLELARARANKLGSLEPVVAKRRLIAFLQRKGYGGSEVYRVVSEVLG
jgi:regulatory protein